MKFGFCNNSCLGPYSLPFGPIERPFGLFRLTSEKMSCSDISALINPNLFSKVIASDDQYYNFCSPLPEQKDNFSVFLPKAAMNISTN